MGKVTFVVAYDDGREPEIKFTDNFMGSGGSLRSVSLFDYKDDFFTTQERDAISAMLHASAWDGDVGEHVAESIMAKVELLTV